MKRFLSILVALMLLVSLLAVATAAVAEEAGSGTETPEPQERTVGFDFDKFKSYVIDEQDSFYLEMDRSFMFENKWWQDAAKVHEIFPGINYRYQPAEELKDSEGNEKAKYTVHYDLGNPAEGDKYTESTPAEDKQYIETEHFRLPAAPTAATHEVPVNEEEPDGEKKSVPYAYFAGWEIVLGIEKTEGDGEPSETALTELPVHLKGVFSAGTDIAMPANDITVKAVWVKNEDDTSEKTANEMVTPDDRIYVLYVSPSGSTTEDMKDWSRCLVTSTLSFTTDGQWSFRFAVVDGEKAGESGYTFDYDDVLCTTFDRAQELIDQAEQEGRTLTESEVKAVNGTLQYYSKDTTAPEVELSTTQQNKVTDGLTVGTTYSISTSLDITDCSSTTVTYVVYKKVAKGTEGADEDGWLQIYDSKTRTVAEGYENNISTSGVITPLEEDVTNEDVYKIVYSVVDSYGLKGVRKAEDGEQASTEEYHPTMLLKVNKAPASSKETTIVVWKVVLYVIAGLSAVGIVVLLCIKPKQQTVDGRYNASDTTDGEQAAPAENAEASSDETKPE